MNRKEGRSRARAIQAAYAKRLARTRGLTGLERPLCFLLTELVHKNNSTDPTADFSQRFERHSQQRTPVKIVDHMDKAIDKRRLPTYLFFLKFRQRPSLSTVKMFKTVPALF